MRTTSDVTGWRPSEASWRPAPTISAARMSPTRSSRRSRVDLEKPCLKIKKMTAHLSGGLFLYKLVQQIIPSSTEDSPGHACRGSVYDPVALPNHLRGLSFGDGDDVAPL